MNYFTKVVSEGFFHCLFALAILFCHQGKCFCKLLKFVLKTCMASYPRPASTWYLAEVDPKLQIFLYLLPNVKFNEHALVIEPGAFTN